MGAGLVFLPAVAPVSAQSPVSGSPDIVQVQQQVQEEDETQQDNLGFGQLSAFGGPVSVDPVSLIPNFFPGFAGLGSSVCGNVSSSQTLSYTGVGAEGFGSFVLAPVVTNGPGGPFTLNLNIPYSRFGSVATFTENGELTPLVQGAFPGATFASGTGTVGGGSVNFLYNYLFNTTTPICADVPNPAGGGLVGRNKYFDNGSALTRDRVYFFYDHVGSYRGLGGRFSINRYVFGVEHTMLDGAASIEVRAPIAGTADSDQSGGQGEAVTATQFGNLGIVLKGVLFSTPTFVLSAGMGVSAPTTSDSELFFGDTPVVRIENRTWILQPLFGAAWAPNEQFYCQFGAQFDFDPWGNPVHVLDSRGRLSHVGTLNDQSYAFLQSAVGYWLTRRETADGMRGIALQGELDFDCSLGGSDSVRSGSVTIADSQRNLNTLLATAGTIFRLSDLANVGVGASVPLNGNALYDWSVTAQVNVQFGPQR